MLTRSRFALAAATALTVFAAPAAAQEVDRIVAFGDSYADAGILRQVILADPLANGDPPSLVQPQGGISYILTNFYPTGRFSGGSNYIDTLSEILGAPVVNYAVGGALATTFPNGSNNTNCGPGGINGGSPASCPLGFAFEVDQALNAAPDATFFPAGVGSFDESDLVTVSIGGNDARYYQQFFTGFPAPMSTFVNASIAGATTQLNRLVAAGAPTISFLAGDTGRLPEILSSPADAAIRSNYSAQFNTAMRSLLAGYANNGVTVHYLDLNLVLDNVLAAPAAYGITQGSAATAYTCPAPTPSAPGCLVNSSGYLFYFDGLHLTSGGFDIVANYIAAQLTAPLTLQAPSEAGMNVGQQFGRTLTGRLDLSAPRDGDMPEGLNAYIVGDAYSRTIGASRGNQRFDSDSVGITVGADYGFGSGVVGVAANYSKPKSNFTTGAADVDSDSIQLGAYAGFGLGGAFVQGYVGYGWDDHDVERRGVVEGMSASPDGHHWIAGAKAGYLMTLGEVRLGPIAGLDFARVRVDSYSESGDPALTLDVGSTHYKSLRGSIGAELRGDFAGGGVQLRPYGALVLEKELSGGDRSVSFSQTASPVIVNHFDFENVSKKAYGRGTVGATARIFGGVHFDAGISMTAGKDQGNETSGHVGLKASF